jgi:two-component system response regulator HydG
MPTPAFRDGVGICASGRADVLGHRNKGVSLTLNVLVVDDMATVRDTVIRMLRKSGMRATPAVSGTEALNELNQRSFDIALVDLKMGSMDGLELLRRIRARWPKIGVVVMSAYATVGVAVEAMRNGAAHVLEKPFTMEALLDAIQLASHSSSPADGAPSGSPFEDLVGHSREFLDAVDLARRAAENDKPLLIVGEPGTGKEAFARAIHGGSTRRSGPFVVQRCAGGSPGTIAELFGVTGGSLGRIADADRGTLFIDEIGDLPAEGQARLLRYLADGEIVREAGLPTSRADVRVIAATSKDLDAEVKAGRFRNDLLLRQRTLQLRLQPLRERKADLQKLLAQYAKKNRPRGGSAPRFSRDAVRMLMSHDFPGNLRELENLVEQASSMCVGAEIGPEVLERLGLRGVDEPIEADGGAIKNRIEGEERRAVEEAVQRNPRNLARAASELGISRTTLWRKMKKYGLLEGA